MLPPFVVVLAVMSHARSKPWFFLVGRELKTDIGLHFPEWTYEGIPISAYGRTGLIALDGSAEFGRPCITSAKRACFPRQGCDVRGETSSPLTDKQQCETRDCGCGQVDSQGRKGPLGRDF